MKVYLVQDCNWQHYEGGGADTVGVFSTREKALAAVEAGLRSRGCDIPLFPEPENGEWTYCDGGGSTHWYEIQDYILDEFQV